MEFVTDYMLKIGEHVMNPKTKVIPGTLGKNAKASGKWVTEPIQGIHAFNPDTDNDIFFNNDGSRFHTGMTLSKKQKNDLENNNNIL